MERFKLGYCRNLVIGLLISLSAFSQTKFYIQDQENSDVQPATSGWTSSGSAIVKRMFPTGTKYSVTMASTTLAVDNSSGTATTQFIRAVSPALKAQTISGTVTGYFRMSIANATGATTQSRTKITVVNRAGTVVATLVNITSGASNLTTTLTSYQVLNAAAITSYACADGDRIVLEVGIGRSTGTTARNGVVSFGTDSATDISAAGSTTANNPNITFSNTLTFLKGVQRTY